MKDITKNGILAKNILSTMTEDEIDFLMEQAAETKPSRIQQTKNFKKRESKKKHKFHDYDE